MRLMTILKTGIYLSILMLGLSLLPSCEKAEDKIEEDGWNRRRGSASIILNDTLITFTNFQADLNLYNELTITADGTDGSSLYFFIEEFEGEQNYNHGWNHLDFVYTDRHGNQYTNDLPTYGDLEVLRYLEDRFTISGTFYFNLSHPAYIESSEGVFDDIYINVETFTPSDCSWVEGEWDATETTIVKGMCGEESVLIHSSCGPARLQITKVEDNPARIIFVPDVNANGVYATYTEESDEFSINNLVYTSDSCFIDFELATLFGDFTGSIADDIATEDFEVVDPPNMACQHGGNNTLHYINSEFDIVVAGVSDGFVKITMFDACGNMGYLEFIDYAVTGDQINLSSSTALLRFTNYAGYTQTPTGTFSGSPSTLDVIEHDPSNRYARGFAIGRYSSGVIRRIELQFDLNY